jgi:hypothetical protein
MIFEFQRQYNQKKKYQSKSNGAPKAQDIKMTLGSGSERKSCKKD